MSINTTSHLFELTSLILIQLHDTFSSEKLSTHLCMRLKEKKSNSNITCPLEKRNIKEKKVYYETKGRRYGAPQGLPET